MSRAVAAREVRIRTAVLGDAADIARVHVQAWHETYRGLVADELLAALSVERNTHMWTSIIASPDATVLVAERALTPNDTAPIVGFGAAGSARDQALGSEGEVTAIYLLDQVKRLGIGRALFAGLLRALAARGLRSVGLWVLVDNTTARHFYEAAGGRSGATRGFERTGATFDEIAYVWDDLATFVSQ